MSVIVSFWCKLDKVMYVACMSSDMYITALLTFLPFQICVCPEPLYKA